MSVSIWVKNPIFSIVAMGSVQAAADGVLLQLLLLELQLHLLRRDPGNRS